MANGVATFQDTLGDIGFRSYVQSRSGMADTEMPSEEKLNEIVRTVLMKESGGRSDARVTGGGYTVSGICQFTDSTYKACLTGIDNDEMKKGALARINELSGGSYASLDAVPDDVLKQDNIKNDDKLQGYALAEYWGEKFAELKQNGIPVDVNSVAIMHQYSADGPKILKGERSTSVLELSAYQHEDPAVVDDRLKKNGLTRESTFGDIIGKTEKTTGQISDLTVQAGKELLKDYALVLGHMNEKGTDEDKKQAELAKQAFEKGDLETAVKIAENYLDKSLQLDNRNLDDKQKWVARALGVTLGVDEAKLALDNPDKKLSEIEPNIPDERIAKLHGMIKGEGIPEAKDLTAGFLLENADEIQRQTAAKAAEKAKDGDWLSLLKEFGPMLGSVLGSGPEGLLMLAIVACVAMAMFSGDDKGEEQTPQQQALAAAQSAKEQVEYSGAVNDIFLSGAGQDAQLKDIGSRILALNTLAVDMGADKTQAIVAGLHKGDASLLLEAVDKFPEGENKVALQKMFNANLTPAQMEALADGQEALSSLKSQRSVDVTVGGKAVKIDMSLVAAGSIKDANGDAIAAKDTEIGEFKALVAQINAASSKGADALVVTAPAATPAAAPQGQQQRGG